MFNLFFNMPFSNSSLVNTDKVRKNLIVLPNNFKLGFVNN